MCTGCNQSSVTNTPSPTASAAYQGVIGQAQQVASTPYQPYTGELVAGLNDGQTRAVGQLEGAYGTARPFYQGGAQQLANASGGLGNVQNYLQAGSDANANVGGFQGLAAGQYGNAAGYVGQSATALAGMQPYMDAASGDYGQAGSMAGQAAGAYGQEQAALGQVGQYLGAANGYFGQAASLAAPQDFASNVGQYENPYTSDVINTTMAQAAQADAAQTANVVGNSIGSGAYGGDRNGIAVATLAGQQAMANNSTIAGLNQANFQQATNEFNAVQGQRQQGASILSGLGQGELQAGGLQLNTAQGYGQAGSGYAGLGSLYDSMGAGYSGLAGIQGQTAQQLGNLGSISNAIGSGYTSAGQLGLGMAGEFGSLGQLQGTTGQAYGTLGSLYGNLGTQAQSAASSGASAGLQGATLAQQNQQAQDTANYQQFQNQIQYPFNTTGFLSNIVQGIGSASGGTQTTQGNALSGIAGAATSGLGVLGVTGAFGANGYLTGANGLLSSVSDERAKDDKQPIGETYDGQTIYSFRYKGDPKTNIGLMAQEVEDHRPDAVSTPTGFGGLKTVDYAKATEGAAQRGRFSRGGGLGSLAQMMDAPGAIRVPARGGLGGLRPHFDDGGDVNGYGADPAGFGGATYTGADGDVPSNAMGTGYGQAAPQPAITASLPAQSLPSASRDPSGLLQNGTDTTALANFWAGKANAMPSPQWSNARAGLAPAASSAPATGAAPGAGGLDGIGQQSAAGPTPVYNPMADQRVRAALHLARGGSVRPHFDDGGVALGTSDGSLQSDAFAQDLARNPLLASRATSAGGQGTMPGGNLSRMPGGTSGMPSGSSSGAGSGLGALTAAPISAGSTQSPTSAGFSPGAASGADSTSSGSDTFGPNNTNLWMSLIAGGAGAMSGGSASGLSNIGKGISEGLNTYTSLRQQDINNARAALELSRQQQQMRIDQQRADDEAAFHKGALANQAAETGIRQQDATSANAARDQTTAINRYPQITVPGVGTFTRDATDPTSQWRQVGSGAPLSSPAAAPTAAPSTLPAPQPATPSAPPAAGGQPATASAVPPASAGQGVTSSPNNPQAGSSLAPSSVAPSWRPVTTVPAGFVPVNSASIALGGGAKEQAEIGQKQVEGLQANAAKAATAQQQLYQMNAAIDGLPKSGLLAPGAYGDQRAAAANAINGIAATVGAQAPFNPNQTADAQELAKGAFRLGTSMISDTNGGREAGFILQSSVKNVPSINNSYLGFKRVASGIDQANQYAMDKSNFISDYYAKFHHTDGAEATFNKLNPWQNYAQRAIDNSTMPSAPPQGVPAGSAYSMSRQQWRGPDGSIYGANGQRVQ